MMYEVERICGKTNYAIIETDGTNYYVTTEGYGCTEVVQTLEQAEKLACIMTD